MISVGWTTVSKREDAEKLAQGLVAEGLAVCVQIEGPIHSVYRWKGELERAEEYRLMVKMLVERVLSVGTWIEQHHPYETPEWVVIKADGVGEKYLSWARSNPTSDPL